MSDDDPIAHASSKVMAWASLAATAAEAFAQVAAMRARERAERDRGRAQSLRAERHARYARDRLWWQPVLDPRQYESASVKKAGLAWAAAQSWRGDPEADRAAALAEGRLRFLRPDVMRLWDLHRAEGKDPIEAMMRVAPLMDRPPARPAEVDRLELTVPRSAHEAGEESFPGVCAECAGVNEHTERCSGSLPSLPVEEMRRQRLVEAHRDAERWFRHQVDGSWVPDYLKSRGLDGCLEGSSPWAVGFAPAGWTALVEHLRQGGYTNQEMLDAGLAAKTKRDTVVDRFRSRLMVSVRDADGVTVGFVGRAAPGQRDVRTPKYLNSPETMLYRKGELLVGLSEQRAELQRGATPVVVEGAFDAMALTAAGDGRYVGVAPSGTAVTEAQMRELRSVISGEVVFALDGDVSGRQAVVRAYGAAHRAGIVSPRAAVLPAGCDPADLWSEGRVAPLIGALDDARPLADLVVDARLAEWPHRLESVGDRVNAAHFVAGTVARLPVGEMGRQVVRVAERLGLESTSVTAAVTDAVSPPESSQSRRIREHVGTSR